MMSLGGLVIFFGTHLDIGILGVSDIPHRVLALLGTMLTIFIAYG